MHTHLLYAAIMVLLSIGILWARDASQNGLEVSWYWIFALFVGMATLLNKGAWQGIPTTYDSLNKGAWQGGTAAVPPVPPTPTPTPTPPSPIFVPTSRINQSRIGVNIGIGIN